MRRVNYSEAEITLKKYLGSMFWSLPETTKIKVGCYPNFSSEMIQRKVHLVQGGQKPDSTSCLHLTDEEWQAVMVECTREHLTFNQPLPFLSMSLTLLNQRIGQLTNRRMNDYVLRTFVPEYCLGKQGTLVQ